MEIRRFVKILFRCAAGLLIFAVAFYMLQRFFAHRNGYFRPDYARVQLSEDTDAGTIFYQTGLGSAAQERLREQGNFTAVTDAQEMFFNPPEALCAPLLGWFTREDRSLDAAGPPLVDLQPGDVLVTLSTHTGGWRHGHAGLVIDGDSVLECMLLGTDSSVSTPDKWTSYTNYAHLRVKDVTPELQEQVTEYALKNLDGVPYHLTSGFIGPKAPDPDDPQFGLQCSYLVWYAWQHFGYDLDSDGGRLVSCSDLLYSDLLEVVQIYGMDPGKFASR